jgi:hypothetical protein
VEMVVVAVIVVVVVVAVVVVMMVVVLVVVAVVVHLMSCRHIRDTRLQGPGYCGGPISLLAILLYCVN